MQAFSKAQILELVSKYTKNRYTLTALLGVSLLYVVYLGGLFTGYKVLIETTSTLSDQAGYPATSKLYWAVAFVLLFIPKKVSFSFSGLIRPWTTFSPFWLQTGVVLYLTYETFVLRSGTVHPIETFVSLFVLLSYNVYHITNKVKRIFTSKYSI